MTTKKMQKLVYLHYNGQRLCHHLNGPERIHDVFQLVLSEDPVWSKPKKQTNKQSKQHQESTLNMQHTICLRHMSMDKDVLWSRARFTRRCWDVEAPIDGCVHLLLDDGSFCIHFVFTCGKAVNTANSIQGFG